MNPRALTLVFAVFLALAVFSVSSNDAANYIANTGHFLYESEVYTPPNVAIQQGDASYWVIPVTAGNNTVTYFPVDSESGELSVSRSVNRPLFEVADQLRALQSLKSTISSNSGVDWVFTQKYQTIFGEMALQLNDEVFQLNTVETSLEDEGISVNLASLKNELRSMSSDADALSEKIAEASSLESAFVTKPSKDSFRAMQDSFGGVFDSISGLNSAGLSYASNIDRLKQEISTASLDAQTKSQLFAIMEAPQSISALRNYNLDSTQIKESFESALSTASLSRDSLLDELDKRILKDRVYNVIYGENEAIMEETDFDSLYALQAFILSEDNKSLWESQSKVKQLEQDYSRALEYYGERNFEKAMEYSEESISAGISVYKAGKAEVINPPVVSQDSLFLLAGALVVLLIVLYAVNNRGKLGEMVSGGEEEELDIYE